MLEMSSEIFSELNEEQRADRRALPEGALVATLKRLDVLCGQRGDIYAVKHRDHHVLQAFSIPDGGDDVVSGM